MAKRAGIHEVHPSVLLREAKKADSKPSPKPKQLRAETEHERELYGDAGADYVDPVTDEWEAKVLSLLGSGDKSGFQKAVSQMLMSHETYFGVLDLGRVDDGDNRLELDEFLQHFSRFWDDRITEAMFEEIVKGDSDSISFVAFHRYTQGKAKAKALRKLPKCRLYSKLKECDFILTFDSEEVSKDAFVAQFVNDFEEADIVEVFADIDKYEDGAISLREFNMWRWAKLKTRMRETDKTANLRPVTDDCTETHEDAKCQDVDDDVGVAETHTTDTGDVDEENDQFHSEMSHASVESYDANSQQTDDAIIEEKETRHWSEEKSERVDANSQQIGGATKYTVVATFNTAAPPLLDETAMEQWTQDEETMALTEENDDYLQRIEEKIISWMPVFAMLHFCEMVQLYAVVLFCKTQYGESEWRMGVLLAAHFLLIGCVGMGLSLASDSWSTQQPFERIWAAQICVLVLGYALEAFAVNYTMFCVGFLLSAVGLPHCELLVVLTRRVLPLKRSKAVLKRMNPLLYAFAMLCPVVSVASSVISKRGPFEVILFTAISMLLISLTICGGHFDAMNQTREYSRATASVEPYAMATFGCALMGFTLAISVVMALVIWHPLYAEDCLDHSALQSAIQITLLLFVFVCFAAYYSKLAFEQPELSHMRSKLATICAFFALPAAVFMAAVPLLSDYTFFVVWLLFAVIAVFLAPIACICQRVVVAVQIGYAPDNRSAKCSAAQIFCAALCKAVICVVIGRFYSRFHAVVFCACAVMTSFVAVSAFIWCFVPSVTSKPTYDRLENV